MTSNKEIQQFIVPVQDKPGALGKIAMVLGKAGINISGISTYSTAGMAYVSFTAVPVDKVEAALKGAGFTWFANELVAVDLPNKPGELGKLCQYLGKEGINIQAVYGNSGNDAGTLFFAVEPFEKGKKVLTESLALAA